MTATHLGSGHLGSGHLGSGHLALPLRKPLLPWACFPTCSHPYTHTHASTHMLKHTHAHTCDHTHTCAYIRTRAQAHMHTHPLGTSGRPGRSIAYPLPLSESVPGRASSWVACSRMHPIQPGQGAQRTHSVFDE